MTLHIADAILINRNVRKCKDLQFLNTIPKTMAIRSVWPSGAMVRSLDSTRNVAGLTPIRSVLGNNFRQVVQSHQTGIIWYQ